MQNQKDSYALFKYYRPTKLSQIMALNIECADDIKSSIEVYPNENPLGATLLIP